MESTRRIPARRLAWLHEELARWQAEGIIDEASAQRIAAGYAPGRRLSLERLVLLLGGGFLGIGLIWLVSANLDRLSPTVRLAGITLLWIAAAITGELLSHPGGKQAARLVTVLAGGGVIFQAAQSLQVPAYTSSLLGVWAGGALAYAYATAAVGPLMVALLIGSAWYGWLVGEQTGGAAAVALSLLAAGAVASSVAVLHERGRLPGFAPSWRLTGVILALSGLFIAAFPGVGQESAFGSAALWSGLAAAVAATMAALVFGDTNGRREALAVAVMIGAALLLVAWSPVGQYGYSDGFSGAQTARAVVGTLVYVLSATWFAVVAARRDLSYLVYLVTVALVFFVTVQSFAVFQSLLTGAALFLVLGVVFIGTGFLVNYGRRRLMAVTR